MTGVRGQLITLVAATTSVVLLAFLVPLGLLLRSEAEQHAIATATLEAQALAAVVALDPEQAAGELGPGTPDGPRMSVFLPDGRVLGTAADRTPSIELAARGRAFNAESGGGVEVLVPVQGLSDGAAVIRAYVPEPALHRGVARTWALLAGLGLVVFGLGLLLADRLGRRLVGSVAALAGTADRLARGDLSVRVAPGGTRELVRVGTELNLLAARIRELLAAEREEVADLAHRLRTPVTALRLDVEALPDPESRARLAADVDALGRVVDEVIRTARRPVREGPRPAADLAEVAGERVGFWSALAEETGRSLTGQPPGPPVLVRAAREDLVVALDGLLENVFAHTPEGAPARVAVTPRPEGGGMLTVDDGGPGLPAGLPARRGASDGGSTGLGLDIARRTAVAAGGDLRLGSGPLGGARVELTFGPPA
ncbi:MAG: HAMP domain-containing protein [Micromonosporaceae bacterium]|nr:HAMP domain-containing protein [Micromonosporaceae bacterium]